MDFSNLELSKLTIKNLKSKTKILNDMFEGDFITYFKENPKMFFEKIK